MNGRRGGEDLAVLIERSADLKRDLVDFACSQRWKRSLAAAMAEAGLEEIDEGDAISTIDRFALQYRLPDGQTVVDRFVASRPDLDAADREMLLGWHDPVEGIFEIQSRNGDAIILLNLIDDLEYRTYSNMGRAAFRSLPRDGFVHARLVPIRPAPGAWLVSGMMSSYRKSDGGWLAKVALDLATTRPELVFRNPEKVEQGWRQMREDRARFVAFFGGDELVLPPGEAYLRSETIAPLPLQRLAAAYPDTVDAVFRKILAPAGLHLGRARRGADAPPEGLVLPARAPSGRFSHRRSPAGARARRSWVKARTPASRSVVRDNGRLWSCTATNGGARARR